MGRLDGKIALITGAASGMGKVAATLFATEGAAVVVADVTDEAGQAAVEEIVGAGGSAAYFHADVSSHTDAEAMVGFAVERFGGLHVLYNNAGVFPADDGSVTDTPEATWDRVMSINLKGVFLGCKYGIPAMLGSGGGSVINVASFVALMGAATPQIAYTASKGGVLSMTREIAIEFARKEHPSQRAVSRSYRDTPARRTDVRPSQARASPGPHPHRSPSAGTARRGSGYDRHMVAFGADQWPQGSSSPTGSCGATSNASSLTRVTIRRCSEGVQACHR